MFNRRIELFLLVGALALFVPPATADATPAAGVDTRQRRAEPVHQPQLIALKAKVLTDMGVGSVRVHPRHRHW